MTQKRTRWGYLTGTRGTRWETRWAKLMAIRSDSLMGKRWETRWGWLKDCLKETRSDCLTAIPRAMR